MIQFLDLPQQLQLVLQKLTLICLPSLLEPSQAFSTEQKVKVFCELRYIDSS